MTVDSEILTALRTAASGSISGTELSHKLRLSRAVVCARIQELRALGYEIEASPLFGYRLLKTPDLLHADDLLSRLGNQTKIIGRDIRVFQETTSTNDVMDKLARDGVKEGAVVFAESQSKGRGRLGRKWLSPAGKGLWFSVLLRPEIPPQSASRLTIAAATALARAVRNQVQLRPEIKWPNDLLINRRKVAGILTELNAELDKIKYMVLGIGVDVNMNASDFPSELRRFASSLKIESGETVERSALAAAILRELDKDYARTMSGQFQTLAAEWEEQCTTLGRDIRIQIGDRCVQGRAELLDRDGALLLRTEHGHLERIIGGDLTVEK